MQTASAQSRWRALAAAAAAAGGNIPVLESSIFAPHKQVHWSHRHERSWLLLWAVALAARDTARGGCVTGEIDLGMGRNKDSW